MGEISALITGVCVGVGVARLQSAVRRHMSHPSSGLRDERLVRRGLLGLTVVGLSGWVVLEPMFYSVFDFEALVLVNQALKIRLNSSFSCFLKASDRVEKLLSWDPDSVAEVVLHLAASHCISIWPLLLIESLSAVRIIEIESLALKHLFKFALRVKVIDALHTLD